MGAASSAVVFSGVATANDSGNGNGRGNRNSAGSDDEIDPDDWIVSIDAEYEEEDAEEPDTYVYNGRNRNADPGAHRLGSGEERLLDEEVTLFSVPIPSQVPSIGGDSIELVLSLEANTSTVGFGFEIDVGGVGFELGGMSVDILETTLFEISASGFVKGIPVAVQVSGDLSGDVGWSGWTPSASVEIGGGAEGCIGRDYCDPLEEDEEWTNSESCVICDFDDDDGDDDADFLDYGCQLCVSESISRSFP